MRQTTYTCIYSFVHLVWKSLMYLLFQSFCAIPCGYQCGMDPSTEGIPWAFPLYSAGDVIPSSSCDCLLLSRSGVETYQWTCMLSSLLIAVAHIMFMAVNYYFAGWLVFIHTHLRPLLLVLNLILEQTTLTILLLPGSWCYHKKCSKSKCKFRHQWLLATICKAIE